MGREYREATGRVMSREEVLSLPSEALAERSGRKLVIYQTHGELYQALARIMIEVVRGADGAPVTMILPVGPTLHYPMFARQVEEQGVDLSALRTFNMDESWTETAAPWRRVTRCPFEGR